MENQSQKLRLYYNGACKLLEESIAAPLVTKYNWLLGPGSTYLVNMPNVTAGYGRFSDSNAFLGMFIYYNMFDTL